MKKTIIVIGDSPSRVMDLQVTSQVINRYELSPLFDDKSHILIKDALDNLDDLTFDMPDGYINNSSLIMKDDFRPYYTGDHDTQHPEGYITPEQLFLNNLVSILKENKQDKQDDTITAYIINFTTNINARTIDYTIKELPNGKYVIEKEDGTLIKINDKTEFEGAWEKEDGSIRVCITRGQWFRVEKDGTLFKFNDTTIVEYAHILDNAIMFKLVSGSYRILKKDGSSLKINGETVFRDARINHDGSITLLFIGGRCSILKKDGTLLKINGKTVFYWEYINDDGSTKFHFRVDKKLNIIK